MKSLKLLFAVALVGLFALKANAQNTDTKSANVTADVITSLSVTKNADLDFGNVSPGVDKTIDPTSDASAAAFTISGGASASIMIDISNTALTNGGGATLPVTYSYSENASANNQSGSSTFTLSTGSYNTALGSGGDSYYWVGGTVSPANTQSAGNYSGTVTLTATYN